MTNEQKLIKNKLGLLALGTKLSNVSRACKVLGVSRDTFYRWKELYEQGGEEALKELTRRKPNPRNRVPEATESAMDRLSPHLVMQTSGGTIHVEFSHNTSKQESRREVREAIITRCLSKAHYF